MTFSSRKLSILQAIIDDYILTGIPVGSRTISKKYNMGLSSATIRNEMSDLEELGLLLQPHVSSGRIPSSKAYRMYVDELVKLGVLKNTNPETLQSHFSKHIIQMEDVIKHAAQVLSELTQYTALVVTPKTREQIIRNLQLVPISKNSALLVLVFESGIVQNKVITMNHSISAGTLYNISLVLTDNISGKSLEKTQKILPKLLHDLQLKRNTMDSIHTGMKDIYINCGADKIALVGTSKIFNYPEYDNIEKAKNFLSLFEAQDKLMQLMQHNTEMEFTVRIGPEIGLPELKDCSIVTASYSTTENTKGTIGIIGPTRMPYAKILRILTSMGNELTDLFDQDEN